MTVVYSQPGQPADQVVKLFSKKVLFEGILTDLKKHEFYQKPSMLRKAKNDAARRRKKSRRRGR